MALQFSPRTRLVALTLLGSSFGCAGVVKLEPAPSAQRDPTSQDVAVAEADGITVEASTRGWPGSARVTQKLTPIHVEIINQGAQPVHGAIADVRLITGGKQLLALAPAAIEIDPQRTTVGKTAAAVDSEAGTYDFPQKGPARTALENEIRTLSLPEGPIGSGERVTGFVYFDPLPSGTEIATLHLVLRERPGGPVHAAFDLPFTARD